MSKLKQDLQAYQLSCKRPLTCKFFLWTILILMFIGAIWFLSQLSQRFQNYDEQQKVILNLPDLKPELPQLNPLPQTQPSPDLDAPEQLPESPTPGMKLSYYRNFLRENS
jgi:hypothetical protein